MNFNYSTLCGEINFNTSYFYKECYTFFATKFVFTSIYEILQKTILHENIFKHAIFFTSIYGYNTPPAEIPFQKIKGQYYFISPLLKEFKLAHCAFRYKDKSYISKLNIDDILRLNKEASVFFYSIDRLTSFELQVRLHTIQDYCLNAYVTLNEDNKDPGILNIFNAATEL